jgi:hypothetical protein
MWQVSQSAATVPRSVPEPSARARRRRGRLSACRSVTTRPTRTCPCTAPERGRLWSSTGCHRPVGSPTIDAEAVALAALRHHDLPVAELDGATGEVKLLIDYRRVVTWSASGPGWRTGCAGTCTSSTQPCRWRSSDVSRASCPCPASPEGGAGRQRTSPPWCRPCFRASLLDKTTSSGNFQIGHLAPCFVRRHKHG